jgi:hypothetical protein
MVRHAGRRGSQPAMVVELPVAGIADAAAERTGNPGRPVGVATSPRVFQHKLTPGG